MGVLPPITDLTDESDQDTAKQCFCCTTEQCLVSCSLCCPLFLQDDAEPPACESTVNPKAKALKNEYQHTARF